MDWEKALLRGKDIKDSLKELESQIDMLQDDKEYYRRLYVEVRDEKFKDEEMKRLREELEFYKRNNLVTLSDAQKKRADEFIHEHYKKCDTGYKNFVYTVTPTNVITIVELRCPVCGEIIDVSSYDE
jgi:hypothetical protein